jgi:hypothetical protein
LTPYDFNLAPGGARQIDAMGAYVYYYSGSAGGADSTITVRGQSTGFRMNLKPGQGVKLPGDETKWHVANAAGEAIIAGVLVIGAGEVTDNRLTGTVEVVDGEKARTLSGGMFLGTSAQGALASNYSFVQLWNPAGSGKNLILQAMQLSSSVANSASFFIGGAPYASLGSVRNKKASAGVGVGQTRYGAGPNVGSFLRVSYMAATQPIEWRPTGNVVLEPGYGIAAQSAINSDITGNFEWFEESI